MASSSPRSSAQIDATLSSRANASRCIPCPWCSVIALRSHQLRCPRRETECPDCSTPMSCAALQAHKASDACSGAVVSCPGCSAQLRRGDLKRHLQVDCTATAFACPSCSRVFASAEDFIYHGVPTCIERLVACQLCGTSVPAMGLATHLVSCASLVVRRGAPPPPPRAAARGASPVAAQRRTSSPAAAGRSPSASTPRRTATDEGTQRSGSAGGDGFGPWGGNSSRGASVADNPTATTTPRRGTASPASTAQSPAAAVGSASTPFSRTKSLLSSSPGRLDERARVLAARPVGRAASPTASQSRPSPTRVSSPLGASSPGLRSPSNVARSGSTPPPRGTSPSKPGATPTPLRTSSPNRGVGAASPSSGATPRGRPLSVAASRTTTATPPPVVRSSSSAAAPSRTPPQVSRTASAVTRTHSATSAGTSRTDRGGTQVLQRLSSRWHALTLRPEPPQPDDVVDVVTGRMVKDLSSTEKATLMQEWRRAHLSQRLMQREVAERLKAAEANRTPRALTTLVFSPPQKRSTALQRS